MLRPVLALYPRVPAPNNAVHKILIGVQSGTHDQLTGCDTGERGAPPAPPAQRPLLNHCLEYGTRRRTTLLGFAVHASRTQT